MVIKTPGRVLLLAIRLLVFIGSAKPIKLLELDVPKSIPLGTHAALTCHWQLDTDVLYSVKWYKDGKEFFRHVPRDVEPRRSFSLPGVNVEESDASGSQLVLSPVTMGTAGRYRCEVSGEGPLFPTVSEHADMVVVALPEHGPIISAFHAKYRVGENLNVNCTSGHSQPATQLSWYVNGEQIPTEEYITSYRSENSLIVTSLMLDLEVTEMHFKKGMLKVKCLATIDPVYWMSNEESAVQEKNTIYHDIEKNRIYHDIGTSIKTEKNTRVDRIHANMPNFSSSILTEESVTLLAFFKIIISNFIAVFLF